MHDERIAVFAPSANIGHILVIDGIGRKPIICAIEIEQKVVIKPLLHCISVIGDVRRNIVLDQALKVDVSIKNAQLEYIGQIEH